MGRQSIFAMHACIAYHKSPQRHFNSLQSRTWVTSIGFSLAFGAMFAKTWRVYNIFNAPHKQKKVKTAFKTSQGFNLCGQHQVAIMLTI